MTQLLALAAVGLVAAFALAPFAAAQTPAATFTARDSGGACPTGKTFCFDVSATSLPDGEVTVTLMNPSTNSASHSLCIEDAATMGAIACTPNNTTGTPPGTELNLTFTVPAGTKNIEYFCNVPGHKNLGMDGVLPIQAATSPTPAPAPAPTPTPTTPPSPTPTTPAPTPTPTPSPSPPANSTPGIGVASIALGVGLLALAVRRR